MLVNPNTHRVSIVIVNLAACALFSLQIWISLQRSSASEEHWLRHEEYRHHWDEAFEELRNSPEGTKGASARELRLERDHEEMTSAEITAAAKIDRIRSRVISAAALVFLALGIYLAFSARKNQAKMWPRKQDLQPIRAGLAASTTFGHEQEGV